MITIRFAVSPSARCMSGRRGPRWPTRCSPARTAAASCCGWTTRISTPRRADSGAEAIRSDLRWLGLHWDDCLRQSERLELYAAAAETLKRSGRLYPCFESDEELAVKHDLRLRRGQPPIYDRAMLKLTAEQRAAAEAGGKRPYWRFRLSDQEVSWDDLVLGRRRVKLPSMSDPVLVRADGTPHALLTSAVDDVAAGISHIIRSEDQANVTGMQIDIMAALGANPGAIAFAHLPQLTNPLGARAGARRRRCRAAPAAP